MKKYQTRSVLAALLLVPIFLYAFLGVNTEAQTCCTPPPRPSAVPRYPQNQNVTVYIDTTGLDTPSGFSSLETQAIKSGIENWNGQLNNSGVTFTVQETRNPPAVPAQAHIMVVQYENQQNPNAVADTQTYSSGQYVSNRVVFYQNIRNVFNIPVNQPPFVRSVARHETGHVIGLANGDNCSPGTSIMNLAYSGEEFITPCDNNAVASQNSVYPSPTPTPEPDPCASQVDASEMVIANAPCGDGGDLTESGSGECNDGIDNDQDGLIDCDEGSCGHYCIGGCSNYQQELCVALGAMGCWQGQCYTPILIDVNGDGYKMTNAANGVSFKVLPNFRLTKLSWTAENSDDAWLVLDRNGNGTIDSGEEQFGNATPQPWSMEKNGFKALAQYDYVFYGGHEDGVIDGRDAVFAQLQLWCDRNHNGISEPDELSDLPSAGLFGIELKYKEWKKVDEFGNAFRYRAKALDGSGHSLGKWAFDVFLKTH